MSEYETQTQEVKETAEVIKDDPVELTELFSNHKKTVTLADTITYQLILLVIISIGYVVINTFLPEISNEMYSIYTSQTQNTDEFGIESVRQALSDMIEESPSE